LLGLLAAAIPVLGAVAQPAAGGGRELTVTGFGGGFQDNARVHLFQAYAAATGRPVRDEVYNGEVARIYAMVQARNVTTDVVMVEAPELVRGCEDGVFERIDWTAVRRDKFIPGGTTECGAGAVGWGVTLFYDRARIPAGPQSFADLWDVRRFPGKRSLRFGPKMTLEVALLADGVPAREVYALLATPEGQARAFRKLDQLRPHLVWWRSGTQPLQLVGSGEVAYALGYVGRTARAIAEGADYPLLWPTLLYSFDYWAVVRGSPNRAEAMRMIDFMTDARPLLALSQSWPVSPANIEAANDPGLRQRNPGMVSNHVAEGLFIDTDFWVEHGADLEARFNAWAAQ
jgi:putative spermidine/putrescine transport system substrate-binding protein